MPAHTSSAREDLVAYLRRQRRLLTPQEAAKILGKHRETVYTMIHEQRLPAVLDGNRWKIDPSVLADWIEERTGVFVAPERSARIVRGTAPTGGSDKKSSH